MINVVWDMETSDPDDYLTLLLLVDHPEVCLKAVTITPGTKYQVGLVKRTLSEFGLNIPIGAFDINYTKKCVTNWHEEVYGEIETSEDAEDATKVLLENCDETTTLITGAPLKNPGRAISQSLENLSKFNVGRMVIQGGFAGVGVVPDNLQLEKFRGRTTCPTFNLNGDIPSAFAVLEYPNISIRRFVSKNVCHGVYYDRTVHERFLSLGKLRKNQQWIIRGMEHYLSRHPQGKKFHDPLAACCAIDESIGTWVEVELFRNRGEWGSRLQTGTNTWIIIDYDREQFIKTLTA